MHPRRLALITTHPIQYYAPWFRLVASDPEIHLKVFYLWKQDGSGKFDPEFDQKIEWDIPLMNGYDYEWVENVSDQPGSHHFNGIHNPSAAKQILNWSPDYVLCMGYFYRTFLHLCTSSVLKSIPFLIRGDSHRLASRCSLNQITKDILIRILFRRFSSALSCGTANRKYFEHLGFSSESIYFCPHGIDTSRFSPASTPESRALRSRWNIPEEHKIILFAGKFIEKKRPLDLLRAFQHLAPARATLLFIGDGPLKESLVSKATKNVVVLPFANQSEMPDIYRAADLFVLPSAGNFETWGLAVQEALACGTPAIVSDHCGCHLDLIQEDINGMVFEAGNVASLTACLNQALNPETLERWSQNPGNVLKTFNYESSLVGLKEALSI